MTEPTTTEHADTVASAGRVETLWRIGADPGDSENVRLLVASTLKMASLAILWGLIYLAYEEPLAASIPLAYSAASFVSLALFSGLRRYEFFRFSQLLFSLLLPFLLMLALGGFVPSSGVVLWSLTSPLGALVFAGRRQALGWFCAYLGLVLLGAMMDPDRANNLPPGLITTFFVMNISGVSVVAYVLLQAFMSEKDLALVTLGRRHRWIRKAFSSYVSPNLVQYLVDHPDALSLGGERRECSFVLTDIADFTTLVERSDPAEVVSLLNDYLEEMTRIALAHDGTIDKIIGDAVAVVFSAPVEQPDHAQRAIACALEMDRFAVAFAATQRETGTPMGDTRIGVNTGKVIIGNVGSKSHFDYRALGDAINTAARLEGANKYLGTRVCVGHSTVERCPEFTGRKIGTLMLKGKEAGVDAYQPLPAGLYDADLLARYDAALRRVTDNEPGAAEAMAALHRERPDDPLTAFYADRLGKGISGTRIVFEQK
jgi:class 3 adenylate cyclase